MASGNIATSDIKIGSLGSAGRTVTITFDKTNCCMILGMRVPNVYFCKLYEYWNGSPMTIIESMPNSFTITKTSNSRVITMINNTSGAVPFIAIGASSISYS